MYRASSVLERQLWRHKNIFMLRTIVLMVLASLALVTLPAAAFASEDESQKDPLTQITEQAIIPYLPFSEEEPQPDPYTQYAEQATILYMPLQESEIPSYTIILGDSSHLAGDATPNAADETHMTITTPATPEDKPHFITPPTAFQTTHGILKPSAKQYIAASTAQNQGITVLNIFGMPVPLAAPARTAGSWSLFNLMATILCVLLLILVTIRILLARSKKKVYEASGSTNKKKRYRRMPAFFISLTVVALAAVLFTLTQNTSLTTVMFDLWSIAFSTALAIVIATTLLCVGKRSSLFSKTDKAEQLYLGN